MSNQLNIGFSRGPNTLIASTGKYGILTPTTNFSGTASPFPLTLDSSNRFLRTAQGTPFFMVGDGAAQILCQRLPSVVTQYLTDRQSKGFNALWMHVVTNDQDFGNADGLTDDGIAPFTGVIDGSTVDSGPNYDFTTPNSVYFARLDAILGIALSMNFLIFLDVMENDAYLQVYENNGLTKMGQFATFLANRYKTWNNIVWMTGNDFQTWNTNTFDNQIAQALMSNIQTTDSSKFQTTELDFFISGSLDNSLLVPYTTLSSVYTYYPAYYEVLKEYNSGAKTVPTHLIETYYEQWVNSGLFPQVATDLMLRKQPYWTILSGGVGYFYGSIWLDFPSGWPSDIDTVAVTQIGYWKAVFTSFSNWQLLIPDQSNVFLTAGFGTPTGNGSGNIQTDNYVTAALTADGSLGMAYCPESSTITIAMTKMRGTTLARWYDPTAGTYTSIGSFANTGSHNFTTLGNNTEGDPDWLLVLTA